jgi:hypothetical protein
MSVALLQTYRVDYFLPRMAQLTHKILRAVSVADACQQIKKQQPPARISSVWGLEWSDLEQGLATVPSRLALVDPK